MICIGQQLEGHNKEKGMVGERKAAKPYKRGNVMLVHKCVLFYKAMGRWISLGGGPLGVEVCGNGIVSLESKMR